MARVTDTTTTFTFKFLGDSKRQNDLSTEQSSEQNLIEKKEEERDSFGQYYLVSTLNNHFNVQR